MLLSGAGRNSIYIERFLSVDVPSFEILSGLEPGDGSPTGRLLEGVIESIDGFYSANLGQDIKRGMRENASRGFFNGSRPPYGFCKVAV
jgi:DNA invertase Pin-like site-specific DNA recombinase